MLLWIAFALMTAAALAAVLLPLARPARRDELDSGALAVYRHQLEEIEDERTRGLVDDGEAAAARVEVSRRLLASADRMDAQSPPPPLPESKRATVALATAAAIPLLTLALYLTHGSPGLPSFPAAARTQMPIERAQIGDLIAKVEARLREHPEDGDGWDVIAPVYFKLGRFRDAANAYARAAAPQGRDRPPARRPRRVRRARRRRHRHRGGPRRLREDPEAGAGPARAPLLAGAGQGAGRQARADALADYKALCCRTRPADAPWRAAVESRIADVGRRIAGVDKPDPRAPGPSAEDVAAAEKLSPQDRAQMIAGMVDGLAERLKRDGRDLAGWLRLSMPTPCSAAARMRALRSPRRASTSPPTQGRSAALAALAKRLGALMRIMSAASSPLQARGGIRRSR